MITANTLFILGAGANVPYGFPDAKKLREIICSSYIDNYLELYKQKERYDDFDFEMQKQIATNFITAFEKSNLKSIDLFLSLNPEYSDSGKRAIIMNIVKAEQKHLNEKSLYNKDDWFQYLFNKTMEGIYSREKLDLYKKNKIGFITFNYDRLLEQYFSESLLHSFLRAQKEIFNIYMKIPLFNIYGKIDDYPYKDSDNFIPYGHELYYYQLEKIKSNINVIDYERNEEQIWSKLINNYERIFFLGFGYADENLRTLHIPECLEKGQTIYGTAFQNTKNEIGNIRKKFLGPWMTNADVNLNILPVDALLLLKEYL